MRPLRRLYTLLVMPERKVLYLTLASFFYFVASPQQKNERHIGGYCDGCEGIYQGMPKGLRWQTTIPDSDEPGEPLEIEGSIYKSDGVTPAPDVILYVYHTDAHGHYSPGK